MYVLHFLSFEISLFQLELVSFSTMPDVDVLIVGGGPTGTMLALELAIQKVSFRIIDKEPVRSDKSRALVIQPRTLELLNRHGIARDIIALGTVGTGIYIFVNKKLAGKVDLDDLGFDDTVFPLPLWISQADTENLLDQALQRHGHKVERPFTAEKIEQDDTGVSVVLCGADGAEERFRCKYAVGCDGAHSIVRHAAKLTFEGAAYPQDFILADLHLDWSDYPSNRLTMFMGQGVMIGFPLKDGIYRLIVSRPGRGAENEEVTLEDFQRTFDVLAPGTAILRDPIWLARFHLHHRGANKYREGRLFVAGDAAHIHSPAGGQGMNTGMQDAVNLGWKLASTLKGECANPESLLDSYDIERRRIGEHLLKGTDRAFQFGTSTNAVFLFLRNALVPWVLPWAVGDRGRRAKLFRFMSELGIRYRQSPIVGTASSYRGPLRGGDRAPDGTLKGPGDSAGPECATTSLLELCAVPAGHHLVVFGGCGSHKTVDEGILEAVAKGFLGAVTVSEKVHRVFFKVEEPSRGGYLDWEGKLHARYGFVEPGYVLVRPDGHVAHIGLLSAMDKLLAWLETYMIPN
jgi:2-polyprenyl-6-methoxyphenol hydroxylase-like FAD-dependent oxidoreductase